MDRPATDHSGRYESADPNKPPEVIDTEAALAYARLLRRESPNDIAKDLCISRATFYRRIEMLMLRHDRPSRTLMQVIAHDELDQLTRMTFERLGEDCSNADFARLAGEVRQQNAARLKLYDDAPAADSDNESGEDWDDWEADESA